MRLPLLPFLLLCCARLLYGADSHAPDGHNVIACGVDTPRRWLSSRPLLFTWDDNANEFKRDFASDVANCSVETVSSACRHLYENVSYAVEMNTKFNYTIDVPWYRQNEFGNETETYVLPMFKCQDWIRAEELPVPAGTWTDRLIVSDIYLGGGGCVSEAELVNFAAEECGKTPRNHSLGARCGDEKKYLEIVFVCDRPKNESAFQVDEKLIEFKKEHYHEGQFAILQRYALIAEELELATAKNDLPAVALLTRDLNAQLNAARNLIGTLHVSDAGITELLYGIPLNRNRRFLSRIETLSLLKLAMQHQLAATRSADLFFMAVYLVTNNTEKVAEVYEKRNFTRYDVDSTTERLSLGHYDELKETIIDYYVDYCKNHTLGITRNHLDFLNGTNAHERILAMYTEIFNPGMIDKKYLQERTSNWGPVLFVLKLIFVLVILIACYKAAPFVLKKFKENRVGDSRIQFNKHRGVAAGDTFANPIYEA